MKSKYRRADLLYDCVVWLFNIMLDVFFREIRPRGSHKVPLEGPLIFVAAPHANQVNKKTGSFLFFFLFRFLLTFAMCSLSIR
jgi:1-acyl-sn-glycerol-3-phosphate acyltransferase